jgi:hypothetical protein
MQAKINIMFNKIIYVYILNIILNDRLNNIVQYIIAFYKNL